MRSVQKKDISEMSRPELELREVYELIADLRKELQEIKTMADDIKFLVMLSHSLIVVRKVGEDKLEDLKKLLD